ncbi:unnamed protein product, partial [Ectocarpus fasciculatus]
MTKSAEEVAKEIQAQIAAQIASVSSLLNNANQEKEKKKAAYRPLLLDNQGRQIDEKGNLVTQQYQIKTLAANVAGLQAQKKKENPYLSHRTPHHQDPAAATEVVDERLHARNRNLRGKRSLKFVEPGSLVKQADQERHKEERKVIAGYASGRRAPEMAADDGDAEAAVEELIAPTPDEGIVPAVEWWDEALLPKVIRETRKSSRAAQEKDDYEQANIVNCKTHKLIHHPVPVKALGGEKPEESLPMYLTKKERKRIRRQAREEREREKRDKLIMGLIPAPETKFKLSNFMKILGDQAVADPSKVELRVIKEMQKRQLNHEMRNLARKLTPAERKEKKRKKLVEDTSRQVHVAVFRVKDFSYGKLRFKVDVNAQQLNLTGTVLLCPAAETNLIVFEGGPKGIKKIIKLMLKRINWDDKDDTVHEPADEYYAGEGGIEEPAAKRQRVEETESDDGEQSSKTANQCDLLWQGILAKRTFHAFRFQECKTASAARKVLEAKQVPHYWDM